MVIAAILAAGSGSRIGADTPKQYLKISGTPMLRRTAEAFLRHPLVNRVLILCPQNWLAKTRQLLADTPAAVLTGSATRTQTLEIAVRYWQNHFGNEDDILLTHDGARPFVSEQIIGNNIDAAQKYHACGTYLACADSLVHAENGFAAKPLSRDGIYRAQTPQSFRAADLVAAFSRLTDTQKNALTDACGVFTALGQPVAIVPGESVNFKITTPDDLALAELIAQNL
ncbi:MAG: 2-C-methyl-D-erythritol 4-phosphate cytidylyltransferase [Oscillospiraceae bacterium]|jgi:2-C-methyl-D-erythritol 4-phosphate cytidylyltransferase|nr:2-C-methyl-D-erythritol 4-phosphate cytidylyltransferase [Oscillospiraceae bacterium]